MRSIASLFPRSMVLLAFGAAALPATAAEQLVEISRACPGVVVELRYATPRNITGRTIYPPGARAMLRKSVADRLNRAQQFLRDRGFALKVWDAYRPASVQRLLWNAVRNPAYVVEPSKSGSLHSWGAAVDVTLVDFRGREVRMPTDFDSFSDGARYDYKGKDAEIAFNLSTLKRAMGEAGFRHIRDEWWHYSVGNEPGFGPIEVPLIEPGAELAGVEPDEVAKSSEAAAKKKARTGRLLFPQRAGETL